ncbi:cysteine ase [Lecanosticta acicola]|uniref:ubiquitinyl hydrolase 1 n=1 Tax=Lecanosticta acicola TaxID=111012 RepID=A0AAI9EEX8_9PEZI|nr:cysteine ase [Lecanosticta acicola]
MDKTSPKLQVGNLRRSESLASNTPPKGKPASAPGSGRKGKKVLGPRHFNTDSKKQGTKIGEGNSARGSPSSVSSSRHSHSSKKSGRSVSKASVGKSSPNKSPPPKSESAKRGSTKKDETSLAATDGEADAGVPKTPPSKKAETKQSEKKGDKGSKISPGSGRGSSPKSSKSNGSPKKSPPKSSPPRRSASPNLVKKDGKLVSNGRQVIPDRVLDGRVAKKFPHLTEPYDKGLWNKLNFCYRNAAVQALLHSPVFYRYMGKTHKNCGLPAELCVVCALQDLMQTYWNGPASHTPPRGQKPAVRLLNQACKNNLPTINVATFELEEDFREELQSDSFEFLQYLLSHVEDNALPSDDQSFTSVFDIRWDHHWHCDECGADHGRKVGPEDTGTRFGLQIGIDEPRGLTLVEYLRRYFADDAISVHCEEPGPCTKKYPKAVRMKQDGPPRIVRKHITAAPEILFLRLGRFITAYTRPFERKIRTVVPYDEYLNLGEFTESGDDLMYRLDGVVAHGGAGLRRGHWIAVCRDSEGRRFATLNDDVAVGPSRGSFEEMRTPTSGGFKGDPYVLVYTRM